MFHYDVVLGHFPKFEIDFEMDESVTHQVKIELKYEGYNQRQLKEIERFKNLEEIIAPLAFNYTRVHGLSNELREELSIIKPISFGLVSRIQGITPAQISTIMI